MIIRIALFSLCWLFAFSPLKAQIVINGSLPHCAGESLRLILYNDYVSFHERTLCTTQIDNQGGFSISIDTNQTIPAILDVAMYREKLMLEPGKTYTLSAPNFMIDETVNPRLGAQGIGFQPDPNDQLNQGLLTLNADFANFLDTSFVALYRRHNLKPLHAFAKYLDTAYYGKNAVLASSARFRLASIQLGVGAVKRNEAFAKFEIDSLQYDDYEYMLFWNEFFDHYLTSIHAKATNSKLLAWVNHSSSFLSLADSLRTEPSLQNSELRTALLLKALGEFYYKPAFDEANILALLADAENVLPNKWQQSIAKGLRTKCQQMRRATNPPYLSGNDMDGKPYTLDQSKGKFVFLSFINSNCASCLNNLELLRTVYEQYPNDLEVVTIITDRDSLQGRNLAKLLGFKWKVILAPKRYQLLDDYKVYGYPLEIIMDRNGAILQFPARSVEDNLIPQLSNSAANKPTRQGFRPSRKK